MRWREEEPSDLAEQAPIDSSESVLPFPRARPGAAREEGTAALALIYEAADVIRGIEEHAAAVEARTQGLVGQAVERLKLAERRIHALEAERQAAEAHLNKATARLQEAERVMQEAEARIAAAEDQVATAVERAHRAEARAIEAEKALRRIEDAIQTQLIGPRRKAQAPRAA